MLVATEKRTARRRQKGSRPSPLSPTAWIVERYIEGVLDGTVIAGELVRLAVKRHLVDLQRGGKRGLHFDETKAHDAVEFFSYLKHSKGEWAGQTFVLAPWQTFIVWVLFGWMKKNGTRRFRTAYVEVARKNGKSTAGAGIGLKLAFADDESGAEVFSAAPLALNTPIPTVNGWTTMADIKVGDRLFDEQGQPTRVTYISPVMTERNCYRMRFHDGEEIIADAEHRWVTRTTIGKSLRGRRRAEWMDEACSVRSHARPHTTKAIADSLTTLWGSTNHSIDLPEILNLPDCLLPIPPYTLGVWLGDGSSYRGSICGHANDVEISEYVEKDGYRISWMKRYGAVVNYTVRGLRTQLRMAGLITHDRLTSAKHIPQKYLRASQAQRLLLLQGLMDTDGTCTKVGECRFTNRKWALADGVRELAISLGLLAHLRTVSVTQEPHYVVSFRAPASLPAFRLKRKYERQVFRVTPRARRRFIVAVEPVESRPVRCISVDAPSHLYLVGRGMIPTHNTKHEQALIVHSEATRMVRATPDLADRITIFKNSLTRPEKNQKYEPLGADEHTLDGLNVHGAIVDELHAHKNRGVFDLMDTATSARRQPLLFAITTAGTDQTDASVCWEQHVYAEQILRGVIQDDKYAGFIFAMDEKDDWQEEKNWYKSNPNLGVSKKLDYMRDQAKKASKMPGFLNTFLRLDLNRWTQQTTRWIDMALWDQNAGAPIVESELTGRLCFAGLDLSSVSDLTALVLVFPDPVDRDAVTMLCRFWCPASRLTDEHNRYRDQYQAWARDGWLRTTPGNAIDYSAVKAQILVDAQTFQIQEVAVDRLFQGYQMSMELAEEGLTVAACGMGFMSMAGPTAELERRLLVHKIRHGGHPVLKWMANNVSVKEDPAGNKKPDKSSSQGKIDGIIGILLALDRQMRHQTTTSVYESRGLVTLGGPPDGETPTT